MDENNIENNAALNEKIKENPSESNSKVKEFFEKRWFLIFVIFLVLLIILCITIILVSLIPHLKKEVKTDFRLSLNLIPEHYSLEIQPHLSPNELTLDGNVVITFICLNTTDKIILHGKGLNIHESSLDINAVDGSSTLTVFRVQYDSNNQVIIFTLYENLEAGQKYNFHIKYDGKLETEYRGFFVTKYKENDIDKYVAATDLQTHYARMVFPCFDEPSLKATFAISVVRRKEHVSLSNMPLLKTKERDEEWVVDRYFTTVVMPTYLVAIAVGDFKRIQHERVSIWYLKKTNIDFHSLLNASHSLLNYFEKYLHVNFDLPKLDHLLIPNYPSVGMENWGLIMYNEGHVTKVMEISQKATRLFSHEIAHQWFGNLVTPKWWDDLWLSEGFSTYFANFGVDAIDPKYRMKESFVYATRKTMNDECSKSFVSLHPSVKGNINKYADFITFDGPLNYGKAAYIIRMMHLILDDEAFKRGLTSYLRENAYGNADSEELWKHLTRAQTKKPVVRMKAMMEPWLLQTGHPIITAIRNYHRNTAQITQTSCLNYENQTSNDVWNIPITLMSRKEPAINFTIKKWLTQKSGFIDDLPGGNSWILLNVEQFGYFRVNYDERNWKLLLWQLQHNFLEIPLMNRIQILTDVMFFAHKGDISHRLALDVFSYFPFEKDVLVLNLIENSQIGNYLQIYESAVYQTHIEVKWKKFIQYCLGPIFDRYLDNWASGEIKEKLLLPKEDYVDMLCMNGYWNCLSAVEEIIKDLTNGKMLNETRLTRSGCGFIYYGSRDDWEHVYKLYTETKDDAVKRILSELLGCTNDNDMIERFIKNVWKPGWRIIDSPLEMWTEMLEYLKREWSSISKEEYNRVLFPLIFEMKDISSGKMMRDFYEERKEDFDEKQRKEIEKLIEEKFKRLYEWKRVFKEIEQWLQNEEWLNININELEELK